jgi:hypothetical protein
MKPGLLRWLVLLPLAGLLLASASQTPPSPAPSASLLEALVEAAVQLAREKDPLRRASICNTLADRLAQETSQAVTRGQLARAAHLGNLLQDLLARGVADNLERAGGALAKTPQRLPEVRRIGEQTLSLTKPLLHQLEEAGTQAPADMQNTARALAQVQTRVDQLLHGRPTPKGKALKKAKGKRFWKN